MRADSSLITRWLGRLGWVVIFACATPLASAHSQASQGRSSPQQDALVVAFAASSDLEPLSELVELAANRALAEDPAWRVEQARDRLAGGGEAGVSAWRDALVALEGARHAYRELELERALTQTFEALSLVDRYPADPLDVLSIAEAVFLLGATHSLLGHAEEADEAFAKVHVQFPWFVPDPSRFNPDILSRYRRVAPAAHARSCCELQITGGVAGTEIFVDFVSRGFVPVRLQEMSAGSHIVAARTPGGEPWRTAVSLSAATPVTVEVPTQQASLVGSLHAQLGRAVVNGADTTELVRRLAGLLEVSRLGVARLSLSPNADAVVVDLEVFDGSSGRALSDGHTVTRLWPRPVGQEVSVLVATTFGRQEVTAPSVGVNPAPSLGLGPPISDPPTAGPAVYETWWFWTAVGAVVVAGAATGAYFALKAPAEPSADPGASIGLEF